MRERDYLDFAFHLDGLIYIQNAYYICYNDLGGMNNCYLLDSETQSCEG